MRASKLIGYITVTERSLLQNLDLEMDSATLEKASRSAATARTAKPRLPHIGRTVPQPNSILRSTSAAPWSWAPGPQMRSAQVGDTGVIAKRLMTLMA